jgi:general nucleoside transport system permease protein
MSNRRRMAGRIGVGLRVLLALTGAALLAAGAVTAAGLEPVPTLRAIVVGAAGDSFGIRHSLLQAVPITLTALGVTVALRANLFNLGGEGQIYMGALAAVAVALGGRHLPGSLLAPLALLVGALGGLAWGAIAGLLRARLGLSEIITTIMLNFVAFWVASWLVHGPIQDPAAAGFPYTEQVTPASRLGALGATVPVGAILAGLLATGCWLLLDRSRPGVQVKDIGEGEQAARFAGLSVGGYIVGVLAFAGAMGGLAGAVELTGNQLRLSDGFSPGWGFDAIAVALIGRGTPFGTLAAGLFFGALRSGIDGAQITAAVPAATAQIIQGVTVLLLVAANSDVLARVLRGARRAGWRRRARLV